MTSEAGHPRQQFQLLRPFGATVVEVLIPQTNTCLGPQANTKPTLQCERPMLHVGSIGGTMLHLGLVGA